MRLSDNYAAREILRRSYERKRRLFTRPRLFLVAGAILAAYLVFGGHGFLKLMSTKKKLESVQAHLQTLEKKRDELETEAAKIKDNPYYKERIARERFGLAKKDEIVYKIRKKEKD